MTTAGSPGRTAWLVVALLVPVALLNYLDRQMLASMKFSVMRDIPDIALEANWGAILALVQVGLRVPQPGRRLPRRPLQPPARHRRQPVRLVGGDLDDRPRHDLRASCSATRALMGISEAFYIPAALALIADFHTGPTRSRAVGLHQMGIYVGVIVGGFGGYAPITRPRLALGLRRLRRRRHRSTRCRCSCCCGIAPRPARRADGRAPSPAGALRELLGNGSFVLLVLYFTLPALAGWVVRDWMPAILKAEFGIGQGQAGVSATLYWQVAAIVGAVAGGWLADRWMRQHAARPDLRQRASACR